MRNSFIEKAREKGLVIEIDSKSGFCFGVTRAVKMAEAHLKEDKALASLGSIVHNEEEARRLGSKGMTTISLEPNIELKNKTILFRAHGEPPSSYQRMKEEGAKVIDATCPVVTKLQERVKKAWEEVSPIGGQVVIYGTKGHAEVIGLVGQTNGEAVVVETPADFKYLNSDKITVLFSQTTKSREGLIAIEDALKSFLDDVDSLRVHNTICAQVGNRVPHLKEFAPKFDMVIFVAGRHSSNGKVLFEVCKSVNPNTNFISSAEEIQTEWANNQMINVGVCGATSTPQWLMEKVADKFSEFWLNRFSDSL